MPFINKPTRITVHTAGTPKGDKTFLDAWKDDSDIIVVVEETGAPGFVIDVYFDDFIADNDYATYFSLYLKGYYEGNAAHNVKLYVYDWANEEWDAFTSEVRDFPHVTAEAEYTFLRKLGGVHMSDDGTVLIRISHDNNGSAGHHMHINQMYLTTQVLGSIDGAGQYTGI